MSGATRDRLLAAGLLGVLLLANPACGRRGNPLPPLRPVPARILDAAARRVGDHVELRFTIPATNTDASVPPAVTRVDVYAAVGPASPGPAPVIPIADLTPPIVSAKPISVLRFPALSLAVAPAASRKPALGPPTTAALLRRPEFLRGRIEVKPPPPPAPAESDKNAKTPAAPVPAPAPAQAADDRPAAGDVATFADDVAKDRAGATVDSAVIRYIVVPVGGRDRFGTPSTVMEVPLRLAPGPPQAGTTTYDEQTLKLTWPVSAPGEKFRVYRSDATGREQAPALTAVPLTVGEYTTPAEFGVERCFIVRSVVTVGPVSIESEASVPMCVTAVDTFPPAAPTRLFDQPYEGKISLGWSPVEAADLAGYLVLRAEGDATALRPLTPSPVTETSFVDTTTKAGVRYMYAVVAVDKAGNRSGESNRIVEVGR